MMPAISQTTRSTMPEAFRREVLADATQPQHATLYALMVVGEALGKVSPEVKGVAPDLPWRPIVSLRHILVHAYWQVDLEIIADVLASDLEPLIQELDRLITFVERPET
jgi:uncharacterized protein with HEPN domain